MGLSSEVGLGSEVGEGTLLPKFKTCLGALMSHTLKDPRPLYVAQTTKGFGGGVTVLLQPPCASLEQQYGHGSMVHRRYVSYVGMMKFSAGSPGRRVAGSPGRRVSSAPMLRDGALSLPRSSG